MVYIDRNPGLPKCHLSVTISTSPLDKGVTLGTRQKKRGAYKVTLLNGYILSPKLFLFKIWLVIFSAKKRSLIVSNEFHENETHQHCINLAGVCEQKLFGQSSIRRPSRSNDIPTHMTHTTACTAACKGFKTCRQTFCPKDTWYFPEFSCYGSASSLFPVMQYKSLHFLKLFLHLVGKWRFFSALW